MQASAEELLLLLKKWESESKRVVATGVIQPEDGFGCAFRVTGTVHVDEAAATFSVGELESEFVLCHISYRGVGFSLGKDIDWSQASDGTIDPANVEELVVLRNPDMSSLALCALISN